MNETAPDNGENIFQMDPLQTIASAIFARHGIDFSTAQRAGGWSNATWIGGGLVLRLAIQPERHTLLREAALSALLPGEAGYPPIVEIGETGGYEWSLYQAIPGQSLGAVWSNLTEDERIAALCQLWQKAQAVHQTNLPEAAAYASDTAWFNNTDAGKAEAHLSHLTSLGLLTPPQVAVLRNALDHYWRTLLGEKCVLNHGDMTLDNVLWHEGQVTALLDFEYAVIAPVELDLNHLVKIGFSPTNASILEEDAGRTNLTRIQQVIKEIATPILSRPASRALLMGYAILLELWLLETWLANPEGEGPLDQWDPYLRLLSLANGENGYLAPLVGRY